MLRCLHKNLIFDLLLSSEAHYPQNLPYLLSTCMYKTEFFCIFRQCESFFKPLSYACVPRSTTSIIYSEPQTLTFTSQEVRKFAVYKSKCKFLNCATETYILEEKKNLEIV